MEIKDIQKRKSKRSVSLSIRTTPEISKWMHKENISPTALFDNAAKELMQKTED